MRDEKIKGEKWNTHACSIIANFFHIRRTINGFLFDYAWDIIKKKWFRLFGNHLEWRQGYLMLNIISIIYI